MKRNTTILTTFTLIGAFALGGALAADHHDHNNKEKDKDHESLTLDVYALDTCPVSGMELGSMGDPVVKEYDGREVRFCCAGCIEPFEKDKEKHFEQIDEKLIEQQKAHYPLNECIVSGMSFDDVDEPVNKIHEGRLVRFCCPRCPGRFESNPDQFMTKLDEAIIEQQREKYPLDTCVVAGMELGSMGEPHEVIVGGTLVRFCCAGCVGGFKENPAKHLATIREAWKAQHEREGGHD